MIHERDDKFDGQEEGEYHFSDEHTSYEIEPDLAKPSVEAKQHPLLIKFNQYRRPIIGGFVALLLLFLVYKMLAPDSAQQDSQIKPKINSMTNTINKTPQPKPIAPAVVESTYKSPPAEVAAPLPTPESFAAPATNPRANGAQPPVVVVPATQSAPASSESNSIVLEKLAAVQEENVRLIREIKADMAQRIATSETQNEVMQGKLQDLNLRITSLETTLARLGRLIQDMKNVKPIEGTMAPIPSEQPVAVNAPRPQPKYAEPKMSYSVQAIIPGRAWLKSDAGDTVTVAEGDVLKDYGRVMKIDPYDGVVQIDTGAKIVTLSYGMVGN